MPRLPSGQPDLSDVAWLASGGNFRQHDALLLPAAKAILDKRDVTQDPHNFCMPDVVPRTTPFPIRFFFNYTHKSPTHMVIVHEGNIHSFRQIFMDGRNIRRSSIHLVRALDRMVGEGHHRHRHGRL